MKFALDAPAPVPGLRLTHLDVGGCEALFYLPDLSHLEGVAVNLKGCKESLVIGWERGMRKAFSTSGSLPGMA